MTKHLELYIGDYISDDGEHTLSISGNLIQLNLMGENIQTFLPSGNLYYDKMFVSDQENYYFYRHSDGRLSISNLLSLALVKRRDTNAEIPFSKIICP